MKQLAPACTSWQQLGIWVCPCLGAMGPVAPAAPVPLSPCAVPTVHRRCIKGSMGDKGEDALQQAGGNPPLEAGEMEFLANVDQPRESPTWVHFWRTAVNASATGAAAPEGASNGTAAAGGGASGGRVGGGRRFSFLVVVFNHNLHENRGYNRLARMARGSAVSMNQDDNLNSQRCNWSRRLLDEMNTRPLVALVGVNGGVVRQSAGGHFMIDPGNFRKDPVTGNFVNYDGLVDIGPMIHPTSAWLALGGIDESYGPRGQAGIFGDWQLSLRTWLAGYRVSTAPHGRTPCTSCKAAGCQSDDPDSEVLNLDKTRAPRTKWPVP